MCSTLSSCRLYSWIRLIWLSKIVSGSTTCPDVRRSQSTNRPFASRLARRKRSRNAASCASGASAASWPRSVIQPSPIASVMSSRQRRIRHQQPSPRRHAVGLVVEALAETSRRNPSAGASAAGRSESRPRRWCCACRRPRDAPCGPCATGVSSIRLMRCRRLVVAGIPRAHVVEKAAVDLVDDLEVPRARAARTARPATSRAPPAAACGWCTPACGP